MADVARRVGKRVGDGLEPQPRFPQRIGAQGEGFIDRALIGQRRVAEEQIDDKDDHIEDDQLSDGRLLVPAWSQIKVLVALIIPSVLIAHMFAGLPRGSEERR